MVHPLVNLWSTEYGLKASHSNKRYDHRCDTISTPVMYVTLGCRENVCLNTSHRPTLTWTEALPMISQLPYQNLSFQLHPNYFQNFSSQRNLAPVSLMMISLSQYFPQLGDAVLRCVLAGRPPFFRAATIFLRSVPEGRLILRSLTCSVPPGILLFCENMRDQKKTCKVCVCMTVI